MPNKHEADILLVEDSEDDVELTLHALRSNNLANRIEVVRDGEEALDFIFRRGRFAGRSQRRQPSVILLDLKLPKVEGLDVLREIRKNPCSRLIPVVILTSSKEEKDLARGYQLGVNSYIQKPVDFKQFCDTVRHLGLYWLVVNQLPAAAAKEGE